MTGTITDPGSVSNAFTYTLNQGTLADNYNIETVPGTLTVSKNTKEIVITADSDSKMYDGSALTKATYTYTEGVLAEGDELTAVVAGTITNVGTTANVVTSYTVMRGETDVTANYTFGDSVDGTLEITKRSVTLTSATDSKTYDGTALTNDEVTVSGDGFVKGEEPTYDVTGSQTLVGSSDNTFTYELPKGVNKDNYTINTVVGTLTVTDGTGPNEDPVDPELVVTKKDAAATGTAATQYALGDTVTFNITATNIYEEAQTITLEEIDGVTLKQSVFEAVEGGETIETKATYTITEADIKKGSFTNTVTAKVGNIEKTAEATVTTEALNGHLTITKETTSEPKNGETYALGETISYKITVKNDGNLTITKIEVKDDLTGDSWTIASLAPGATSEEFTTSYTVTEADIQKGEVLNVATATGTSPDPKEPEVPVTPGEDPEPTDEPKEHLTIEKVSTSTPANGKSYALGETISYKITVTNDGNVTMKDFVVTDELTGDEWRVESLAPNASTEYTTTYKVTEADILAGEVLNVATAKSNDPDDPEIPVTPGKDPEPTDDLDTTLSVKKEVTNTPADGEAFKLGETIEYKITVTNEGNATYSNVKVVDKATGLSKTIETLAVGESVEFTTSHDVTEDDILAGSFTNTATAAGDPINGKTPQGEDTVTTGDEGTPDDPDDPPVPPIEGLDTTLTVKKDITNTPADGKAFKLGETIEYMITVTNDGNAVYKNVVVEDGLVGKTGENAWTIEELKVGESREFAVSYTVTEEDIAAGSVTNAVTAKGDPIPDPKDPDNPKTPEGEDEVTTGKDPDDPKPPVDDKKPHLTVTKVTTSQAPENGYALGDTITYKITVTNDGNQTIKGVEVTDELTGDKWTIEALKVGESKEFTAEYIVTEKDTEAGEVVNTATATGSGEPEVTPGTDTEKTKQTVIYYTNYPIESMENAYSKKFDVTPGYQVVDFLSVFTTTPSGYRFTGWTDIKSGKTYSVGDLLKALANGGTGSLMSLFTTSEATDADGTTADTNEAVTTATPDADYVLYAQWTRSGGGRTPDPDDPTPADNPEEPIDDPDTPLAPGEIDEPEIDDPEVPLAPGVIDDGDEEIDDADMPLTPFTGDERHTAVWSLVSVLSLLGIVLVGRKRKEEEQ